MDNLRVGVVASFDFTRDDEIRRWVPDGIELDVRWTAAVPADDNLAMVSALAEPAYLATPVRSLCAGDPAAIAYACTACSFVRGAAGERALRAAMTSWGARHALTTSGAVVDALRSVGARRVAVVHPYAPAVGRRLQAYLTEHGFQTTRTTGFALTVDEVPAVQPDEVADLIREGDTPTADAVFVSCTGLPTYETITPLEAELGKPVITANQATMWALLRAAGTKATGPGQRLLAS
ncbi:maleate cis-trans isomerase family protein [Amycolatopsis granulosa]|uniref:maleate cis-trans isomerase family protein n=1 Tax=Amycolatopsis granulosa TaxID=185684 RepID=UPI00141DEA23|nr:Asp/Glu racemase [Amycolatopsis granulosa]NIH85300.1 maleate isomerase [Amycolatopsis granulosa]